MYGGSSILPAPATPNGRRPTPAVRLLVAGGVLVMAAGGVLAFDLAAFLAVPLFLLMPSVRLPFIDPVVSAWLTAGSLGLWAAAGIAALKCWRRVKAPADSAASLS
ncbi:MAG: hypothetical protein U1E56_01345 [Bauldia sp.]